MAKEESKEPGPSAGSLVRMDREEPEEPGRSGGLLVFYRWPVDQIDWRNDPPEACRSFLDKQESIDVFGMWVGVHRNRKGLDAWTAECNPSASIQGSRRQCYDVTYSATDVQAV